MPLTSAHALVIGISQYQQITPLPAVADADDLAGVLRDPASCGYPPEHVTLLREADATRRRILDELDQLAGRTRRDSTVIVYFSGHGGRPPDDSDSFLMPVDSAVDSPEALVATAISSGKLTARLAAIPAERLVVILDCCHAAPLAQPRGATASVTWAPLPEDTLARLATGRGRVVMAASTASSLAYVMRGARHGLFTEHLIAGLRGAAGRADGLVRVLDLYDHVQRNVVARNPAQRPVLKTELEDNFAIAAAPRSGPVLDAPALPAAFAYDVLVVHAPDDRDRAWTMSTLIRQLEQRGVRVCVEDRDAELSGLRLHEIERLVSSSRFTLPVLTPRFASGRFERLQVTMAQQLGVEQRRGRLVPIIREPCDASLGVRIFVHLDMTRDEQVAPGVERLVKTLMRLKNAAHSATTPP